MGNEPGMPIPEKAPPPGEEGIRATGATAHEDRGGPTWRGFAVSILVAIVLSVVVTLLLGGSWSSFSLRPAATGAAGGCGEGKSCCPLPQEKGG